MIINIDNYNEMNLNVNNFFEILKTKTGIVLKTIPTKCNHFSMCDCFTLIVRRWQLMEGRMKSDIFYSEQFYLK